MPLPLRTNSILTFILLHNMYESPWCHTILHCHTILLNLLTLPFRKRIDRNQEPSICSPTWPPEKSKYVDKWGPIIQVNQGAIRWCIDYILKCKRHADRAGVSDFVQSILWPKKIIYAINFAKDRFGAALLSTFYAWMQLERFQIMWRVWPPYVFVFEEIRWVMLGHCIWQGI